MMESTNQQNSKQACELCHSSFLCGSLSGILKIIETTVKESYDTYAQELYREFRSRIERYGYQFPHGGESSCWLSDKPSVVKDLITQASSMYKEIIGRSAQTKSSNKGKEEHS